MMTKFFLGALLAGLSLTATAQESRTAMTHTMINDDDKTLAILVVGTVNGKGVTYRRRFNVAGMSAPQKEALKRRVFDSLGVGESPKPVRTPAPPLPPKPELTDAAEAPVTFACKACTGRMKLEVSGTNFSLSKETDSERQGSRMFPMTVTMAPGEYRYQYWQNGVLQMQQPFTVKAGDKTEVTVK